ncbi:MAG: Hsp20/alpha crystallin family protein [Desulfomonilia bacterium]|jgi:HSP20 family protein|uniref:Spore protein SP21 n=1 Tax=anaerobic digester metagenome TaxID=1263854 RepID=A0A485LZE4_9ZZZZ|nr:Hsp20/alpha crystallin family protein [Pseudomonadota bacterium]HON37999.1 Hsp20/alpha crystallin family protein [Deltaproteobacteria bacterium]HRS55016.1 Hsp20/alpha crystallin family protein [Desulfomonilia bacterium]HPD20733.1 Hsp20/alpha crystallin family protein [Deltaproteobacteria bacterium]HPX19220.1 Hsp20/alpha crystallin family protein [Deltaproteobacteria bacterium]
MARIGRISWSWDPIQEMERLERDWSDFFSGFGRQSAVKYPPVNIFTGEDNVIITSEIPGVDPEDVDLTVTGDVLTLKGTRRRQELGEGQSWHRRERGYGDFYRTIQLPYNVESSKVEASYSKGILKITLPRAEADKARKISVKTA